MDKIKIRLSSLIDGEPWLFTGEGTKKETGSVTVLEAEETIQSEKVAHHIEISKSSIKVSRRAEGVTQLEFFPDKQGDIFISTSYGDFSGKTITKSYAVKKTQSQTHISLAYNTSFDQSDASLKKIQISYSEI